MKALLGLCFSLLVSAAAAEDTIYLEETIITGNQELPKVLYILPWRDMETALLPQRVPEYTEQSVLIPIYPDEQRRELAFRQALDDARRTRDNNSEQADPITDQPH